MARGAKRLRIGKPLNRSRCETVLTDRQLVRISFLCLFVSHGSFQKLRWEHVDLKASELRLPDTKAGGRAVLLVPSAVRLLASFPRDEDNPWV